MIQPVIPGLVDQSNLPQGACACVVRHRQGVTIRPGREFVDLYGRDNRRGDGHWYSADLECLWCKGAGKPIPIRVATTPDQGHHDPRCPKCYGRGTVVLPGALSFVPLVCPECFGTGQKLLRGEPAGPEADRPAP